MIHLDSPIETLIRIKADTRAGLDRLGLHTIRDLIYHFPARYADESIFVAIANLAEGDNATVRGTLQKIQTKKSFTTKVPMSEGVIEDMSGTIKVVWFNQPYLAKMLHVGNVIEVTGKVSASKDGTLSMANPVVREEKAMSIDSMDSLFGAAADTGVLTPVYPESKGVSSLWLSHTIARALHHFTTEGDSTIADHIPSATLQAFSLPSLLTALIWIHTPRNRDDATIARKRFAFDEIFTLHVARQKERAAVKAKQAYTISIPHADVEHFIKRLGFPLTGAQQKSVDEILNDIKEDIPMSRLLEGDVGSGKTAVAAIAAYATIMNRPSNNGKKQTFGNLQVAYMAPTEILATQHFESFIELFKHTGISIALITGSGCRKFPSKVASVAFSDTPWTTISRPQLSKWIANGEIPIVIGTHALIQKSLTFKHLALAIIDEQHRFGLQQRQQLAKKDSHFPHLLSMTATPIPRTLALTIYGDLDLSLLDQMPHGRKQVQTTLITPDKRDEVYKKIHELLAEGRQAYVICPRIDNPDPTQQSAIQAKSVMAEAARLQKDVFPHHTIGVLHSKMSKDKKEEAMRDFSEHHTDILVATSVVEVGVNVPNATVIIIEGAERFGLSQLHQLRGRVQRSSHQPYCFLFAESKSEKTQERMEKFLAAKNGFELAEYDLLLRGSGELSGAHQWGVSDIGMEALRNQKLVQAARQSAITLVAEDPTLQHHPLLAQKITALAHTHFE